MLLSVATAAVALPAVAGTNPWSYDDYQAGSYVPRTGDFAEGMLRNNYWTKVWFVLDAHNIAKIGQYNQGNGQGTDCEGSNSYLTLDVRAVDNGSLQFDADSVYTTLPDPKVDLESNKWFGKRDESEVVALGALQADHGYYMRTYWNDSRSGQVSHAGKIVARFAMSAKGWSDYNNCTNAAFDQVIDPYGPGWGDL